MRKNILRISIIFIIGAFLIVMAVYQDKTIKKEITNDFLYSLNKVKDMRIFFGHQSVGKNVLEELGKIGLNTVNIRDKEQVETKTGVLHAYIGRNVHPDEKIADFAHIIRGKEVDNVEIAFMKFCFVDVSSNMTVDEILRAYVNEMEMLEKEFPDIKFVYVTMPLTGLRGDIKGRIKRLLGMSGQDLKENIPRNYFNRLLREAKKDTGRLFDLADIESKWPDGEIEKIRVEGESYNVMVPIYTNDGGHLNKRGRKVVAKKLIIFLKDL